MAVVLFLMPQTGWSEQSDLEGRPWEKFGVNLGVFFSAVDSSFRIGSGVGLDIDVEDLLDLDIYELAYSYSFLQDDRVDLAAGIGFYVMPMDFGIKASGLVEEEGSQRFTAPLPVLGLRMDVALTPKWFLRSGAQVFYLEYKNFTGSVIEFRAAVEYNPWKHVGIGLGFDTLGIKVEADGEDWPEINFKGNVEFDYAGLQLYLRLFY